MIDCLVNYVTLSRGCSPVVPGSGIYLDQRWAQVSIKGLASMTDPERDSVNNLYSEIYLRASYAFESDVRSAMAGKFTRTDVVSGIVSHEYRNPWVLTTIGAELRGVFIEVGNSPYIEVSIDRVQLYVTGAGTVPVFIYDANNGNLLDTVNLVATAAGYTALNVNKTYAVAGKTRRLFVCYDATALVSANTERLSNYGDSCFCECSGNAGDFVRINGAVIATGGTPIEENLDKGSNSYGLIVTANLQCSVPAFICNHLPAFRESFLIRLLIEVLNESAETERINSWIINHDRDEVQTQLYGNENVVGLFDQMSSQLSRTLEQINPNDTACFECDENVMMVSTIP